MNKDQVKGNLKTIAGKAQQKAGQVVGNPTQQLKGIAKQAEGEAQKVLGDLKDGVKRADPKQP